MRVACPERPSSPICDEHGLVIPGRAFRTTHSYIKVTEVDMALQLIKMAKGFVDITTSNVYFGRTGA